MPQARVNAKTVTRPGSVLLGNCQWHRDGRLRLRIVHSPGVVSLSILSRRELAQAGTTRSTVTLTLPQWHDTVHLRAVRPLVPLAARRGQ